MTTRLEAEPVSRTSAQEERDLFPLEQPRPQVRLRHPLVFGAGTMGTAAIEQARSRCPALVPLYLAEGATLYDLQSAMRVLSSPTRAGDWVLWGGRLELIAVGQPKELAAGLRPLVERLGAMGDGSEVSLTTLELGDPCGATALNALRPCAPARFHLARDYYHGRLSLEHHADLAGRLLAAGLPSILAERSDATRASEAPVLLGGSMLWEPEVTIGQLVALELEMQCFQMVTSPRQGAVRRLSSLLQRSAPAPLADRLREQFRREEEEFIERFFAMPETAPVESLLDDAHAGEEEATRAVRGWCTDTSQGVRRGLYEVLTGRYGLRTAIATVERVARELRQAGAGLAGRENAAAGKRRCLARRAITLDLKRRDAARRWPPFRQILSWLRGRSVRKLLGELFPERAVELLARYEKAALEGLRSELGTVRARFTALLDAQPDGEIVRRLLQPGYPNLVPWHKPETIGSALQALVLGLGVVLSDSPVKRTWAAAAGQLLDEKPGEKKLQDAVTLAAKQVSDGLPAAANPLASALREMLPDESHQAFATLLTWAARPRTSGDDSRPWVEEVVFFAGRPEETKHRLRITNPCLEAVTCIYWPK